MSAWTYISGVIDVSPMGRTQPEKRYILDSVLEHLPKVTGSEGNMTFHVVQKHGYNMSSSHNEFGEPVFDDFGRRTMTRQQSHYLIVLEASLRDRWYEDTLREFNKWLVRLAKRIGVDDILVRVSGYSKKDYSHRETIFKDAESYDKMFEKPSWVNDSDEPNWCEYLMWDRGIDSNYPMSLEFKYFNNSQNDAEYTRRKQIE